MVYLQSKSLLYAEYTMELIKNKKIKIHFKFIIVCKQIYSCNIAMKTNHILNLKVSKHINSRINYSCNVELIFIKL